MTTLKEKLAALERAIDQEEMYGNPVPLYVKRKILEDGIALEERVATALWMNEAERAAPNVARMRTAQAFAEEGEQVRDRWLGLAAAAIAEMEGIPDAPSTGVKDEATEERVTNTGFGLMTFKSIRGAHNP